MVGTGYGVAIQHIEVLYGPHREGVIEYVISFDTSETRGAHERVVTASEALAKAIEDAPAYLRPIYRGSIVEALSEC